MIQILKEGNTIGVFCYAGSNLKEAIRRATVDFSRSEEGKKILAMKGNKFTLEDVIDFLPNWMCMRFGFAIEKKVKLENIPSHHNFFKK